jgi:hypothetical protein
MTNTVSTPSWFTFRKSVKPSNFGCPSRLQNPIKLDVDKYVTTRILFCKCSPHLLSHSKLFLPLSSVICLSYFTHHSSSLSLIRKHMYSYISENNFGPSNQIIVPTSYKVMLVFSLTAYFSVSCCLMLYWLEFQKCWAISLWPKCLWLSQKEIMFCLLDKVKAYWWHFMVVQL